MEDLNPSDVKSILHSKRANIYYIEHCRILVKEGRVEYVVERGKKSDYFNIPIANTTVILLGPGTSVTQASIRYLAKAGVLLGFCGGGGTPFFGGTEWDSRETEMLFITPQSEYRPTNYLQIWVSFWFDNTKRLKAAKLFQQRRIENILTAWFSKIFKDQDYQPAETGLYNAIDKFRKRIEKAENTSDLLANEAELTKSLYRNASKACDILNFKRSERGDSRDMANKMLDAGNYLAYGLGAASAWVLGLPHGLAVLHGKTRRGGLVFDIADIIKDALILPQAFISASNGDDMREFRERCTNNFIRYGAMDIMIDTIKDTCIAMKSEI